MRVLVTLKSDVLTPEDGEYGSQGYPWKIVGQDPTPTPWTGKPATAFASGSGTETDPYMIKTAEQLAYLAQSVNNGTSTYSGQYIALGADIDLGGVQNSDGTWSGQQWTPFIFRGEFNGNGYSVSNIYVPSGQEFGNGRSFSGLFSNLYTAASVKNVVLESGWISGDFSGGIMGGDYGCISSISNCINKASVYGKNYAGGIVGNTTFVDLENCTNYGNIESAVYAGGIGGHVNTDRDLINCRNYGNLNAPTTGDLWGSYQDGTSVAPRP